MRIGLNTFKHLLPSGKAWRLTVDRKLRQFFQGLSVEPGDVQDFQDVVWNDYRPLTTTKLAEWQDQFGLLATSATVQERRNRLAAEWQALGGQDPRYLQDIVQAAGFPLFIHEWWVPDVFPLIKRNPADVISPDGTGVLVTTQLGKPGIQLGRPSTQLGKARTLGILITDNLPKPIIWPDTDQSHWPFFLYFGGQIFGDTVNIPTNRFAELKTLLLKLCPAQQWIGVIVELT